MRKVAFLGVLVGLSLIWGCGSGVVKTEAERANTYRGNFDLDMRQIVDDWDSIWLVDRQYRLTRWQVR